MTKNIDVDITEKISCLAGSWPVHPASFPVFSPVVLDFLEDLSHALSQNQDTSYATLGFWLRRKHLETFRSHILNSTCRMGRGMILHIPPTNIPVLFVYSFAISLLAGNSNIVRISPRIIPSVQPLCRILDTILKKPAFSNIKKSSAFISYKKNDAITATLSNLCNGRIIWGGDDTIRAIRKTPLPPQAVELAFADRYSISIFDTDTLARCSDEEVSQWTHRFYNDTYEMDQNACSSPKLIFWLESHHTPVTAVQERWWKTLSDTAAAYDLAPIKVTKKYTQLWQIAMTCPQVVRTERYTNLLYVYTLNSLPADITHLSGNFGQFFQYTASSLSDIFPCFTSKIQTISTIGLDNNNLRRLMISHGVLGGDRVVPVGQALDMHVIWDGINMLATLSRIIS